MIVYKQNKYTTITESITFGTTVGVSLLIAKLLDLENPYWVPVSCLAVMQGISTSHVWERALHRVIGTVVGLGLTWLVLQFPLNVWYVCLCILLLQIIVEYLVVRNYGLAAVFISMLTIFLAEPNISLTHHGNSLIEARLLDTLIGSVIGAIGGWLLYHERLHFFTKKHLIRAKIAMRNLKSDRKERS